MSNTKELLDQLRIDRNDSAPDAAGSRRGVLLGLCAGFALMAVVAGVFFWTGNQAGAPLEAAIAPAPEKVDSATRAVITSSAAI
ncbi:MAG: hypothetical protein V4603_15310, partial [Pseudomonadota bacterium]